MLLSRVAESLYWINRYLERAENISRFVEVSMSVSDDSEKANDVLFSVFRASRRCALSASGTIHIDGQLTIVMAC